MTELPQAEELECTACGVCCFSNNPDHVPLLGGDHADLTTKEKVELTVWRGNVCFMKQVDGHCINLVQSNGRFTCAIYERRPMVCREFERGGECCDAAREQGHG